MNPVFLDCFTLDKYYCTAKGEGLAMSKRVSEENSIKNLQERIENAKQSDLVMLKDKVTTRNKASDAGIGLRIAADIIAGVLLGAYIGYQLDKFFETKPWLLSIFILFGFLGGLLNIVRITNCNDKLFKGKK